jgi:hypothetical protein
MLGCYQIHITDENVKKMDVQTKYGSYEFLVMPFKLCNTQLMFMTLMNYIQHEKLDEFMIIYIDDILMYLEFKICFEEVSTKQNICQQNEK